MQNSREKDIFKLYDNSLNRLAKLVEDCNNRLTLETVDIFDGYIKGRLKICLKMRTWNTCQEFQIMLLAAPPFGRRIVTDDKVLSIAGANNQWSSLIENQICYHEAVSQGNLQRHGVFIPLVGSMEEPQRVIPSSIWLNCSNHFLGGDRKLFRFLRKGQFEFISVLPEGEIDATRGFAIPNSKRTDQIVEGGTQVRESITNNGIQVGRDFLGELKSSNLLGFIRIYLGRNFIRIACDIGIEALCEIYDMGFSPFDLGENPKKRFTVHSKLPLT